MSKLQIAFLVACIQIGAWSQETPLPVDARYALITGRANLAINGIPAAIDNFEILVDRYSGQSKAWPCGKTDPKNWVNIGMAMPIQADNKTPHYQVVYSPNENRALLLETTTGALWFFTMVTENSGAWTHMVANWVRMNTDPYDPQSN